jgi:hypothetical protein
MFALVSPLDGNRVLQIETNTFLVAEPFFWVECPDSCKENMFYINGEFINYIPPSPPVPLPNAYENKLKAISLLTATDWVTFPDVVNTSITPHLLNQDEFIEYRRQLRIISLDPIDGNIDWPVIPIEKWAK